MIAYIGVADYICGQTGSLRLPPQREEGERGQTGDAGLPTLALFSLG